MAPLEEFQEMVLDACNVVEFQLIRKREDLEKPDTMFRPLMAHQIFGESENIFGYEGLRVRLLFTAGDLQIYIGIEYTNSVDKISNGDIKADNIVGTIAEKLPDGCYFMSIDEFLKTLERAEKFKPFGEKLGEHISENEFGEKRTFEFYNCNYKNSAFLKYFQRLETFILWFVDAASYIDVDDPQWNYFTCFEKYTNENGDIRYASVGYTTVYEYYAFPSNIRPRISQMLILPPFQKMGVGTQLLETIYKYYQAMKNVVDITVEDPSEDFQRLRNLVDIRLCKNLKSFAPEQIKKGFSKVMAEEACQNFKINARQCRRVYEILRLHHTNVHNKDEYRLYRLDVKKRLNVLHYKQCCDIKKLEKANMDTEWLRALVPSTIQRIEQLQKEFEEIELSYNDVLKKM